MKMKKRWLAVMLTMLAAAFVIPCGAEENDAAEGESVPVVYFTSDISPEGLVRVFEQLGWEPEHDLAWMYQRLARYMRSLEKTDEK